jgi:hypothetical protein
MFENIEDVVTECGTIYGTLNTFQKVEHVTCRTQTVTCRRLDNPLTKSSREGCFWHPPDHKNTLTKSSGEECCCPPGPTTHWQKTADKRTLLEPSTKLMAMLKHDETCSCVGNVQNTPNSTGPLEGAWAYTHDYTCISHEVVLKFVHAQLPSVTHIPICMIYIYTYIHTYICMYTYKLMRQCVRVHIPGWGPAVRNVVLLRHYWFFLTLSHVVM